MTVRITNATPVGTLVRFRIDARAEMTQFGYYVKPASTSDSWFGVYARAHGHETISISTGSTGEFLGRLRNLHPFLNPRRGAWAIRLSSGQEICTFLARELNELVQTG